MTSLKPPTRKGIIFSIWLFSSCLFHFLSSFISLLLGLPITIKPPPATATVTLNQENLKPDGKIKLKPGTYNVTIKKQGFNNFSTTLELKPNQTTYFYRSLDPTTDNLDYYQNHPDDASRVQHIADAQADLDRKNYTDSDPIFKITPYSSYQDGFSIISEKQDNTSKILLKINLLTCSESQIQSLKEAAYQYLKNHQINPDNYDINLSSC